MPGPGKRKSKSTKSSASTSRQISNAEIPNAVDAFLVRIDDAEGWNNVVAVLCEAFGLPDMNTRSGLKKIHAKFPEIYKKLVTAFTKYADNENIVGGIVCIWAKMSVDAILRDKLMKEGLLSKIMPSLEKRSLRIATLQALSTVTHHGGTDVRQQVAKEAPTLLRLMQEFPDDLKVNELVTAILAHAVNAVVTQAVPDRKMIKTVNMPTLLKLTLHNMRRPDSPFYLVAHAADIFTNATLHCARDVKAIPAVGSLLVAFLRSTDLTIRCSGLGALIRLNLDGSEPDQRFFDPNQLMSAVGRGFPPLLSDILMNYGFDKCETTLRLNTSLDYQRAMMRCVQDHDLYALGKTLAELILRTEFSTPEGGFQTINERTGQREIMDVGLPFKMWTDALPICAKTLRARGSTAEMDMADILDIKFFIVRQRIPDAIAHAERAIQRNPNVAYFYYAIGLGADLSRGLRAVKKGLKCKQMTPFVRFYMLWRGVELAGDLGVTKLQEARPGDVEYSEGIAFLTSALDDAKAFVSDAPPDARHMHKIINWYIILTLAIRGPELSPDLRELQTALMKLEVCQKFNDFLGYAVKRTQILLTREMITRLYATAAKDWKAVVERYDQAINQKTDSSGEPAMSATDPEHDLAAWLDNLSLDGHDDEPRTHCVHPKINTNTVELYRCSWCGNPSAILRKCGGCSKTRYCDSACQKSHWSDHKVACKGNKAAATSFAAA